MSNLNMIRGYRSSLIALREDKIVKTSTINWWHWRRFKE